MKRYAAPWSPWLWGMSALMVAVCVFVAWMQWHYTYRWLTAGLLMLPVVSLLFIIREYVLEDDNLRIRRLLWDTVISLEDLQGAKADGSVMNRSIRIFGNGGGFSFTGIYHNRAIGNYRAFVTDPKKAVILRFSKRAIVVSPDDPESFVRELNVGDAVERGTYLPSVRTV